MNSRNSQQRHRKLFAHLWKRICSKALAAVVAVAVATATEGAATAREGSAVATAMAVVKAATTAAAAAMVDNTVVSHNFLY